MKAARIKQISTIKLGIRSEFIKIAQNQNENLVDVNVEKVEDLGNYKLITAKMGSFTIKSKVTRVDASFDMIEKLMIVGCPSQIFKFRVRS